MLNTEAFRTDPLSKGRMVLTRGLVRRMLATAGFVTLNRKDSFVRKLIRVS